MALEELEKHLILNSNRLRTFEDARLEIVTYVEAKFCLSVRDSKPSESGAREHADPTDVDAINEILLLVAQEKEKGRRLHKMVVPGAAERIFREAAMFNVTQRKGNGKKGKMSKSWSKSAGEGKSKESEEGITSQGQDNPKVPKGPKVRTTVKLQKLIYLVLEKPKSETSSETLESAQTYHTDNSNMDSSWFDDGWSCDEWNDDWSSLGWHESCKQTYDNSANSISLGGS